MRNAFSVGFLALLLGIGSTSPGSAAEPRAKDVRDKFATSGDKKLETAAEALGDHSLLKLLQDLREEAKKDPQLRKIIQEFE